MDGRIKTLLTPRDVADALGVSESSLKRWADEGLIEVARTAGGHRRIALADAIRFARGSGLRIARPEAFGLAEVVAPHESGGGTSDALFAAFLRDDWRVARGLIVSAYLDGESVAAICDGPLREALRRAGELWQHGSDGIVVEHRAVDTCLQALSFIRSLIPAARADAPIALGGGFADDPYVLPSLIAAVVAADAGFRDVNLGPAMPTPALLSAIERYAPALVWRTVSSPVEAQGLASDLSSLLEPLSSRGRLVLGGRGVPSGVFKLPHGTHYLESMSELAGFARGVLASVAGTGVAEQGA